MPQTSDILDALRRGDVLTPLDAQIRFGTMRLAARVSDAKALLEPGEEIVSERHVTTSRKVVARYRLVKREPAQGVLPW